ncbi:MAG: flagellar basal body rod protein FlgC [Thioclava marina]|jgi:flagellar basal-body rod protein FlgC|uniref:Flagellar basal body rod protein FlgB n=1 Tax=Thioclava marina TaxID=1915077 RepID=A0ABX3MR86_9RHOB|nr:MULTISPECIES: flagellar basal body rod protein FlgC [Thioclava]MBC7146070.1 flagellar basal body rod protein FlgC [Thioclava marina]OOY14051.1 flagellar basal body rod protein FlgC [Thioclava marina]OOY29755.1 flagellar basal body rod protein FlgC [Thioclava sp. L04-15]TNE84922.1 MAG: flagellar basal body rod protein FlgC [Paracoccaceae bacterium]
MSDFTNSMALSASGMKAQSMRLRHTSENIANADTPGYHRKTTSFQEVVEGGETTGRVQLGPVQLDRRELTRIYDPGHPMADESGHYDGSNVDLVVEIADAREAQRSYEANLRMFDQARQMSSSLLDLLRR